MKQKDYEKFRIGCELIEQSGADFILVGDAGSGKCYQAGRCEDVTGDLLFIAVSEFMASRLKDAGDKKFQALIDLQVLVNAGIEAAYKED